MVLTPFIVTKLIAHIEYNQQRVYIRSVLTHAEYDTDKWKDDEWFDE